MRGARAIEGGENAETDGLPHGGRSPNPSFYHGVAVVTVALSGLFALLGPTYWSMATAWYTSDTFAHGFLVAPISALLVWDRRVTLARIPISTDFRALIALLGLGAIWWVSRRGDLPGLEQLAATAMIPATCWLLLGRSMTRAVAFPLLFLLFAVPIGQELIAPMMSFTASFTVFALRSVGVPVYAEAMTIVLPNAVFEVIEACSGVRYLIVSICLATLFAHLLYRSLWRKVALVALAVVLSVIGNGLRAFGIVMIAYHTEGRVAVEVDHVLYGWVFFGLIMLTLGWLGSLWRESDEPLDPDAGAPAANPRPREELRRSWLALVAGLVTVAVWPASASYLVLGQTGDQPIQLALPRGVGGWETVPSPFTNWRPHFFRPAAKSLSVYRHREKRVGLEVVYFSGRVEHARRALLAPGRRQSPHSPWLVEGERVVEIELGDTRQSVFETRLSSSGHEYLLVWHWNWVSNHNVAAEFELRIRELAARLLDGHSGGAAIALFTTEVGSADNARAVLESYLLDMWSDVESSLRDADANRKSPIGRRSRP